MNKVKKDGSYEIKDHQLYFTRFTTLLRLFRENKISPKKRWMAVKIFFFACLTQVLMILQRIVYAGAFRKVDFKKNPPVFIIGHWRSGTTHLHYLMSKNPRFGYPSNYNVFMLNFCLVGKGWIDRFLAPLLPDKRPMDNVKQTLYDPAEEDTAVANYSIYSGIHVFFFPRNRAYYEKYTLMKGLSAKEKSAWQKAYDAVLRIISVSNKYKPLLLKSPTNTGRPSDLKELFPGAKFVFIHRNPYEVYRSTRKLYKHSTESQFLQDMSEEQMNDLIFANYNGLLQTYIEKRSKLAPEDLIEISYDELSADGLGTMKRIYDQLGLEGWEEAMPRMKEYLDSVEDYERNVFKPLPADIVARIQKEWAFSFEEWGYNLEHSEHTMKSSKTV